MLNKNGNEMGKLSGYSSYSIYKDILHHLTFIDKYISKQKKQYAWTKPPK
jgi:hypothetical protein